MWFIRRNYRDDIQFQISDLLNVSVKRQGVQAERASKWARLVTKHARYAWQLIAWPQFTVTEARAFSEFWNATDQYNLGDRVFYTPTALYYDVAQDGPPIGTLPTDTQWFTPSDVTTIQTFIAILQRCRRRIGQLLGAFPTDPRIPGIVPVAYPAQLSQRGTRLQHSQPAKARQLRSGWLIRPFHTNGVPTCGIPNPFTTLALSFCTILMVKFTGQ